VIGGAAVRGGLRHILVWLAPALLCALAVAQMGVVSQSSLSRWKMGGFGMYSGTDTVRSRWIRAVLLTGDGELPVPFDRLVKDRPALALAARTTRALPEPERLRAVGQALLNAGAWADCTPARVGRVSSGHVKILARTRLMGSGCRPMTVRGLRLEVWRYRYASSGRRLRAESLVAVKLAARGAPRANE